MTSKAQNSNGEITLSNLGLKPGKYQIQITTKNEIQLESHQLFEVQQIDFKLKRIAYALTEDSDFNLDKATHIKW